MSSSDQFSLQLAYSSIEDLEPYPAGKPLEEFKREYGIEDVIKLASNENPLGCSPHVTLSITKELAELFRYPDANGHYLKQALSDYHELPVEYFTLGNGSEEIINLIGRCFVNHSNSVVFGQYSFIAYPLVTASQGATPIEVPAKNYGIDLKGMLSVIKNDGSVKVVFIANPNNPTGTLLTSEQLDEFLQQVPRSVLVVLDEAYVDYEPSCDNQNLIQKYENLIILRTFSKAYGLAGLRVGYAISNPQIGNIFNRVRQPFNVNRLAQSAAIAALADQEFLNKVREINLSQREWLYNQIDALGLSYVKSHTNFILLQVNDAAKMDKLLLQQGIIIRSMEEYGLHEWIRVTIGTEDENIRFIDTLTELLNCTDI